MLMHDHALQSLDPLRNPNRVINRKAQLAWILRFRIADTVVGRFSRRKLVVGRILGQDVMR